jgi:hypothetical protein
VYPPTPKASYPPQVHENGEVIAPTLEPFEFNAVHIPGPSPFEFKMASDGVFYVYETKEDAKLDTNRQFTPPDLQKYYQDQVLHI